MEQRHPRRGRTADWGRLVVWPSGPSANSDFHGGFTFPVFSAVSLSAWRRLRAVTPAAVSFGSGSFATPGKCLEGNGLHVFEFPGGL